MAKKPLYNLGQQTELFQGLVGAFKALERGDKAFVFRGRAMEVRTNAKGRASIEIPAYFTVKFRVYAPQDGKSGLMAIIDDLFASAGEVGGKPQWDNPILWGRIMRNANQGESLFFFNDPSPREAIADFKAELVKRGIATQEQLDSVEPPTELREKRPAPIDLPPIELPPMHQKEVA